MYRRITMLCLILLFAFGALAQEGPSAAELEKRIKDLEARLEEIAKANASPDLDELRRQIEILSREIEGLKLSQDKTAVVADTQQYGLGAAASKVYRSDYGVSLGGYGEMLYETFDSSRDDGVSSGKTDKLDFLRAILYAGYKFNDRVIFNSEIEFEHATTSGGVGEVSVEFGYLDFLVRPEFNVRAGMVLLPVGLINELHEPTAFLGARRPQVEQRIIPSTWRENGVGVFGDIGQFTYRAYVVNGFDSEDFSSSGVRSGRQKGAKAKADDLAIVGRLDWQPLEGTMFGGSIYSGGSGQGRTSPAGASIDGKVTITELHADAKFRGWMLRALWSDGSIDDAAQINVANGLSGSKSIGEEFGGWYAEAGYDLAAAMNLGQHSLIPYVRYEEYDTQKSVPTGYTSSAKTDIEIFTLGVAWKPIPQTIIKIDYQNVEDGAGTGVDQFNAALGYIF